MLRFWALLLTFIENCRIGGLRALPAPAKGNNFLLNPEYLVPKLVCFANFALAHKNLGYANVKQFVLTSVGNGKRNTNDTFCKCKTIYIDWLGNEGE